MTQKTEETKKAAVKVSGIIPQRAFDYYSGIFTTVYTRVVVELEEKETGYWIKLDGTAYRLDKLNTGYWLKNSGQSFRFDVVNN